MQNRLHYIQSAIPPPQRFTFPFNYVPHPLAVRAAAELQQYLSLREEWHDELDGGKMFGVLVVSTPDVRLAFLAAYSGLLAGRNDWQYFVPPVFDSQSPTGYFKSEEQRISLLNNEINSIVWSKDYRDSCSILEQTESCSAKLINDYKLKIKEAKIARDLRRTASQLNADDEEQMIRESQFMKAELRRLKHSAKARVDEAREAVAVFLNRITELKQRRSQMSEALQKWLFSQYVVLNSVGESRTVYDIFANTPIGYPPAGAGDCCAPKLLQYAYQNQLHPLCMAEFWWGRSPRSEIRHHLHYYPACNSKCKPILGFMMQGLDVDPNPHDQPRSDAQPSIIYEDQWMTVVSKPSGMPSVPGKISRLSVEEFLQSKAEEATGESRQHGEMQNHHDNQTFIKAAHRLDMDTSGLLLLAKTPDTLQRLHRQFANHEVRKSYVAVLDGIVERPSEGTITLPLSPDPIDRPRQIVDHAHGKPSLTEYSILKISSGKTIIRLSPLTGHTHQLRVHCAHAEGLSTPILGDTLYGHPASVSLRLHAFSLFLKHPHTGEQLQLEDTPEWLE